MYKLIFAPQALEDLSKLKKLNLQHLKRQGDY